MAFTFGGDYTPKTTTRTPTSTKPAPGGMWSSNYVKPVQSVTPKPAPTYAGGGGPGSVSGGPTLSPVNLASIQAAASTWNSPGIASNPGSGISGGGYGGGTVGGGGGGYNPPTIAPPVYTETQATTLDQASQQTLQADIAALEAQYGMTLAEIATLSGEAGERAKFLLSQLQREQGQATDSAISDLLSRGIYRSGITAENLAEVDALFSERRAEIEMNKSSEQRGLMMRLGQAAAELASAKGVSVAEILGGNYEAELAQIAAGLDPSGGLDLAALMKSVGGAGGGGISGLVGQIMSGGVGGGGGGGAPVGGLGQGVGVSSGAGAAAAPAYGSVGDAWSGANPQGQPRGSDVAEQWMANQRAALQAGPAGGSLVGGAIWNDPYRGGGAYGAEQFINLGTNPQVLGGQNGQTFSAQQFESSSANPMSSGTALFGSPKVNVDSFIASLGPTVTSGLTSQDIANLKSFYGATGIPADAAYNIAASASRIGAQSQWG